MSRISSKNMINRYKTGEGANTLLGRIIDIPKAKGASYVANT